MIEELKQNDGRFALGGGLSGDSRARNAMIDLLSAQVANWQPNRWAILLGLMASKTAAMLAEELRISEPAVYKNIQHGRLEAWVELLDHVELSLDRLLTGKAGSKPCSV